MADAAVDFWKGEFGNSYSLRNAATAEAIEARRQLWMEILDRKTWLADRHLHPETILEVGANIGLNLRALRHLSGAEFFAVEPNDLARATLIKDSVVDAANVYADIDDVEGMADLALTSGVLIHIPPAELLTFCRRIHARARHWIVAIEYFSSELREVEYRGHEGKLWTRDFGSFWLDNFADLEPVACGFAWKKLTTLDNLTWWLLAKS